MQTSSKVCYYNTVLCNIKLRTAIFCSNFIFIQYLHRFLKDVTIFKNCNLTRRNEGGPPVGRSKVPDNTSPWNKPGFCTAASSATVAPFKVNKFAN